MTYELDGKLFMNTDDPKQLLIYWIEERTRILHKRQEGEPKPWSKDPVFQSTYFCNVRREEDKTTKWIRNFYSPYWNDGGVAQSMFEYNMVMARFLNWPDTLQYVWYQFEHKPYELTRLLEKRAELGLQVWSGAYIITTHGIPMPKAKYLAENVLGGVYGSLDSLRTACRGVGPRPLLSDAHRALMQLEGLGSFLAAQVLADLKNTPGHPLQHAPDWWSFVAPGPGSIRGLEWFHGEKPVSGFLWGFKDCREYVDENLNHTLVPKFCNQDLQNCLCEYDKFMRVTTGTGRSKRNYQGAV